MKLNLATKLEQQQVLAPQMILSMDILLLNSLDLENRIERELTENPALEVDEGTVPDERPDPEPEAEAEAEADREVQEIFDLLDEYERRYGGNDDGRRPNAGEVDGKYEAMLNQADRSMSIADHVRQQLRFQELDPLIEPICMDLAGELDHRGYLAGSIDEIARALSVPESLAERALADLQRVEPAGIGARDLRECLLLQLANDPGGLEGRIVADHLQDLLENRLPRIAQRLGVSLGDVKEAREIIGQLNPHPGVAFDEQRDGIAVPEIFVDEVDGKFVVRIDEELLPALRISPTLSGLLRTQGQDPEVREFVKSKVESARWLIHAIEQRRRTVYDIAQAIVDHQEAYFRLGPGNLNALTMQAVADDVGVHISTVSRATNGKYVETPFGVMELRRFFTGGVENASGGIESRDNVCHLITEIIADEDVTQPLSDSQLTAKLQERGVDIARRTVSKYRERAGIGSARLRREY